MFSSRLLSCSCCWPREHILPEVEEETRRAVGNAERELETHTELNCKRFVSESENPSNTRYTRYTLHATRCYATTRCQSQRRRQRLQSVCQQQQRRRRRRRRTSARCGNASYGKFFSNWEIAKHNLAEPSEQKSTKTRSESKREREQERARACRELMTRERKCAYDDENFPQLVAAAKTKTKTTTTTKAKATTQSARRVGPGKAKWPPKTAAHSVWGEGATAERERAALRQRQREGGRHAGLPVA